MKLGDEVVIPWGIDEVHGILIEIYGHEPKVRAVIELRPGLSDWVVDEPETVVLDLDQVRPVEPAA
ncbi:MAG: hypothetical protein U5R31_09785 [Acidimicrobiia bacterium]|nr:hypothetical protein [Acidimicrobiia bacterium]